MLINGKKIAEKINRQTALKIKKLRQSGIKPRVVVFLVGHFSESEVYVRQKEKLAKKLGFDFELKRLPKSIKQKDLEKEIFKTQNQTGLSGVILQLPLPKQISTNRALACLLPEFDIDCLSDISLGRLILKNNLLEPPTAGAILEIIKDLKISLPGKQVVMIGSGLLVGKPLAMMLMNSKATLIVCNHSTKNLKKICLQADVIISGAGKKNLIVPAMVKKGTVVIDAGFSFNEGKATGDADVNGLDKKGAIVTPTPGGVGPITVACLLRNAAICASKRKNK